MTGRELAKCVALMANEHLREYATVLSPVVHIAKGDEVHVYYVHPDRFQHAEMDFVNAVAGLFDSVEGDALAVSLEVQKEVENDLGYRTVDNMAYVMVQDSQGDTVQLVSPIMDAAGLRTLGPWREASDVPEGMEAFR